MPVTLGTPINSAFVRSVTTSIQYEAAENTHRPIDQTVREQAVREGDLSSAYRPSLFVIDRGNNWDWSTTNITNHYHGSAPGRASKEEKEEDSARTAAIVGSILAVLGAGLVGFTYSLVSTQRAALHQMHEVREILLRNVSKGKVDNVSEPVLEQFGALVDAQIAIDELNTGKITNYFFATMGLLAGGAALAAGGFWMIPCLMTAGKVTLLLSAMGAALNFGSHFNDGTIISKCYEAILGNPNKRIEGLADSILSSLSGSSFQPLVPSFYVADGVPVRTDSASPGSDEVEPGVDSKTPYGSSRYLFRSDSPKAV